MTADLVIRPLASPAELDLFRGLSYTLDDELADDLAAGRRHPEWMWVALRGGRLEARAAWWGRAGDDAPSVLDVLDMGEVPGRLDTGGACCGRRSARSSRRDPPARVHPVRSAGLA